MSSPAAPASGMQQSAGQTSNTPTSGGRACSTSIKPSRVRNLIHVTIKQVLDAAQNSATSKHLLIGNTVIDTVRLCGILSSIDQEEHITNYVFYDGTGSIAGKIWPHTTNGRTDLSGAMIGAYYEFIGSVGHTGQSVWLVTCRARKITDYNEIPLHYIKACYDYIHLTKQAHQSPQAEHKACDKTDTTPPGQSATNLSLDLDKEAILFELGQNYIRESDDGASLSYLVNKLQVAPAILRKAVDSLVEGGHIYATTDMFHYKIAED